MAHSSRNTKLLGHDGSSVRIVWTGGGVLLGDMWNERRES